MEEEFFFNSTDRRDVRCKGEERSWPRGASDCEWRALPSLEVFGRGGMGVMPILSWWDWGRRRWRRWGKRGPGRLFEFRFVGFEGGLIGGSSIKERRRRRKEGALCI